MINLSKFFKQSTKSLSDWLDIHKSKYFFICKQTLSECSMSNNVERCGTALNRPNMLYVNIAQVLLLVLL